MSSCRTAASKRLPCQGAPLFRVLQSSPLSRNRVLVSEGEGRLIRADRALETVSLSRVNAVQALDSRARSIPSRAFQKNRDEAEKRCPPVDLTLGP